MVIGMAIHREAWDSFLGTQQFRPFLQSWTMGEVYRDCGQEPIRLEVQEDGEVVAICQAILVPAKRGRHLSIPYGPVINLQPGTCNPEHILGALTQELTRLAKTHKCSFIRVSPFWPSRSPLSEVRRPNARPSPLHLLAEHIWYLPLTEPDPWQNFMNITSIPRPLPPEEEGEYLMHGNNHKNIHPPSPRERGLGGEVKVHKTEEELLMSTRKTTRNLIRRAEKDGVTVEASADPDRDIEHFLTLHEETHHRHGFTPYSNTFFRSQLRRFAERKEATLYLARFQGEVAAASIHMHAFGETSYHHGASTHRLSKVPASYLLQWTAIRDALKRGDHVYNFWGIAPPSQNENKLQATSYPSASLRASKLQAHPFSGVTLFKTGFGGRLLELVHCMDFPLNWKYHVTRSFEQLRKWKRGF